jgi:hypothetical protein
VEESREWECSECVQKEEARNAPIPPPVEDDMQENAMEDEDMEVREQLVVMSWNADALRT